MPEQPEIPLAAHAEVDSMLSRKFGKEIANYFSGMASTSRRTTMGMNSIIDSSKVPQSTAYLFSAPTTHSSQPP
jgi:NAD+ diphosphatase